MYTTRYNTTASKKFDMSHPSHRTNKNSAHHLSINVNAFTRSVMRTDAVTRSIRCIELTRTTDHTEPSIKHLSYQRDRRSDKGSEIRYNVQSRALTVINQTSNKRMNTRRVYCIRRVGQSRAEPLIKHQTNMSIVHQPFDNTLE